MASGLFGVGVTGLAAAQAGLVTTGQNISNANTPGFHRQEAVQSNAPPRLTGAGFIGQGVRVDTVRRVYSEFLEGQVGRAEAQASYQSAYSNQVAQIDNLLSDPNAGLAPVLQSFFESVNEVAANPASGASRQAMLSGGQTLAARMRSLDGRLREIDTGVNAQIGTTIDSVNAYARQIATLNSRITQAQVNPGQPPNDLLDQRDKVLSDLNALVGASAVVQADGNMSVSIGTGQSLVVGTQAFSLAATPSAEFLGRTEVSYVAGSTSVLLSGQALNNGSLGALLAFRTGALSDAQNELGRVAAGLAETFNAQHRLGQDLGGAMGGDFFTPAAPQVSPSTSNTGTATLTAAVASASALTASDYRLAFTGGAYQLTRLSDNTTTSFAGLPQTIDGVTIQLGSGAPANGDTFLISPTRNAAADFDVALAGARLIAAAAPVRTGSAVANAGTGTISAGVVNAPLNVNLQQPVTITFTSATTFNVTGTGTGNPVGVAYTAGAPVTYNGWTVSLSGAPRSGDTFTVTPNTNATGDNRNALRLAELQVTNTLAGGTSTYNDAYAQLVTSIGNTTRESGMSAEAQASIARQARSSQQSVSGVNLDEEAANLMRFQQAYQASGKVIEVASRLFDTILSLGR